MMDTVTSTETDHDEPAPSRQARVGALSRQDTKRRLLDAAGVEFTEHGYAGTTVNRIAARAGVTVQTLYLAWGSKSALLRAHAEARLNEGRGEPSGVAAQFEGATGRDVATGLAAIVTQAARSAATVWKLYRDASATDPAIAADWDQLQALRRTTIGLVTAHIPHDEVRAGLDRDTARDTAWAIASPEMYELLVRRGGYSIEAFQTWVATTLAAALLR